jgi:hypothetical protein
MLLPKKHLSAKNFIFSARTLSHRNLTAAVFGKDEKVETIYRCSLRLAGGDEVVVEFGGAKEGKPRSRDELVAKNGLNPFLCRSQEHQRGMWWLLALSV